MRQGLALYTPAANDVDRTLHAVATYKDNQNKDTEEHAVGSSEYPAQASNPANSAPVFADQDLNTAGDQSDMAVRSVPENMSGANVGDPVAVTDPDGEPLMLDLMGDDADLFKVTNAGQITTAEELDYEGLPEGAKYHMVTLIAVDPSGASDSILVQINVTDAQDDAVIMPHLPPAFADDQVTEFDVEENSEAGTAVGTVTATDENLPNDTLTYSLGGADGMYFAIDAMGRITVGEGTMLDFESGTTSYSVTVTATDSFGLTDSIAVTINVTDVEESACVIGGAVSGDHSGGGLDMDCQTLLGIMDELVGEDGTAELNWSPDTPIADWQGVSSFSGTGRVYSIRLPNAGLAGVIPASFNDLDALEKLTLSENDLTGEIPDLSDLDNLIWLILSDNNLSGSVPATLGDMAELDYLYLHRNDLSGSIPVELGDATRLRRLYLHGNGLTGEIPTELGNLSRLRNMILSSNMLTGEIPAELAGATNLKLLYLDNNMLTGSIPAELGSIMTAADDTLRRLYLNNNMLSGDVPAELGNLANLAALRLSGNDLTGCIPAAIIDAAEDAAAAGLSACE